MKRRYVRVLKYVLDWGVHFTQKRSRGMAFSPQPEQSALGRCIYKSAMLLLLFIHLSMGTNCSLTLNAEIQEALRQQNMSDLSSHNKYIITRCKTKNGICAKKKLICYAHILNTKTLATILNTANF